MKASPPCVVLRGHPATTLADGSMGRSFAEAVHHLVEEARMYMDGQDGRLVDCPRAWELFETAATLGSLEAKYYLALFNRGGLGLPPNPNNFHRYLSEANSEINSDKTAFVEAFYTPPEELLSLRSNIQNSLGVSYLEGLGVKKEVATAARHFCEATESGNLNSICNLSLALLEAVHEAKCALGSLRDVCDVVERTRSSPSPTQVDGTGHIDTSRSGPFVPFLTERMRKIDSPMFVDDCLVAIHQLGIIGGDALRLLAKESDDALGPHNLGVSYELGLTSAQPRLPDAVKYYVQAARSRVRKFVPSQYALARLYLNAARNGSVEVKRALKGYEEESLVTEGLKWLQFAAQSNFPKGQAFYAALYTEGCFGLKVDHKQADICLRQAINSGWPMNTGIPTVDSLLDELPKFEPFLSDSSNTPSPTADKLLRHKSELEERQQQVSSDLLGRSSHEESNLLPLDNITNKLLPRLRLATAFAGGSKLNGNRQLAQASLLNSGPRYRPVMSGNTHTVRIESLSPPSPAEGSKFYSARDPQVAAEEASNNIPLDTASLTVERRRYPSNSSNAEGHHWESGLRHVESEGQAKRSPLLFRRRGMSSAAALQPPEIGGALSRGVADRPRSAEWLDPATATAASANNNKIYASTYSDFSNSTSTEDIVFTCHLKSLASGLTASRLKCLDSEAESRPGHHRAGEELDESTADGPGSVSMIEVKEGVTWNDINALPESPVQQRWLEAYSMHETALRNYASGEHVEEWLPKLTQSYCLQWWAPRREPDDLARAIDRVLERTHKDDSDKVLQTQALFVWLHRYLHALGGQGDQPSSCSEVVAASDTMSCALSRLTAVVGLFPVDLTSSERSPIRLWDLLVLRAGFKSRYFRYPKGAIDDLTLALECCPESRKYEIHLSAIRTILHGGSPSELCGAFLNHFEGYVDLAPTHDRWPINYTLDVLLNNMSNKQRRQTSTLLSKLEKRCVFQPPECRRPDLVWLFPTPPIEEGLITPPNA